MQRVTARAMRSCREDGLGVGVACARELLFDRTVRRWLCVVTDGQETEWVEVEAPGVPRGAEVTPRDVEQALVTHAARLSADTRWEQLRSSQTVVLAPDAVVPPGRS